MFRVTLLYRVVVLVASRKSELVRVRGKRRAVCGVVSRRDGTVTINVLFRAAVS